MIKLYGNPYSRANRVRWTLIEADVAFEEEEVTLGEDGTRSAAFLKINPNGHVPVIEDNGLVLFESVPIALYIAKKYAGDLLYASDIADEACLWQWSVWAMTELEKNMETAALHCTWFPEAMRDQDKAAKAQAEVRRCLGMIETAIEEHGVLVGNRFSVADLIVSEVLTSLPYSGIDLGTLGRTGEYLSANLSRPAARAAFAADILEPFAAG